MYCMSALYVDTLHCTHASKWSVSIRLWDMRCHWCPNFHLQPHWRLPFCHSSNAPLNSSWRCFKPGYDGVFIEQSIHQNLFARWLLVTAYVLLYSSTRTTHVLLFFVNAHSSLCEYYYIMLVFYMLPNFADCKYGTTLNIKLFNNVIAYVIICWHMPFICQSVVMHKLY